MLSQDEDARRPFQSRDRKEAFDEGYKRLRVVGGPKPRSPL
jgi:hypothetical protein